MTKNYVLRNPRAEIADILVNDLLVAYEKCVAEFRKSSLSLLPFPILYSNLGVVSIGNKGNDFNVKRFKDRFQDPCNAAILGHYC